MDLGRSSYFSSTSIFEGFESFLNDEERNDQILKEIRCYYPGIRPIDLNKWIVAFREGIRYVFLRFEMTPSTIMLYSAINDCEVAMGIDIKKDAIVVTFSFIASGTAALMQRASIYSSELDNRYHADDAAYLHGALVAYAFFLEKTTKLNHEERRKKMKNLSIEICMKTGIVSVN